MIRLRYLGKPYYRVNRLIFRSFGTGTDEKKARKDSLWTTDRVNGYIGHSFPDFIEFWNRTNFYRVGYGLTGVTVLAAGLTTVSLFGDPLQSLTLFDSIIAFAPAGMLGSFTAGYWVIGLTDIRQTQHAVRRNYPVLGNMRYILETVRTSSVYLAVLIVVRCYSILHSFTHTCRSDLN
jgi:hypothetical protein